MRTKAPLDRTIVERTKTENVDLRAALVALSRARGGDCWCPDGVGDARMGIHTPTCDNVRRLMDWRRRR